MGKVTGIGGVFFKFRDPKKMTQWYSEVLGMTTNDYGVLFAFNNGNDKKGFLQLGVFEQDSNYFGDPSQQAMVNFRVDNMSELIKVLEHHQVKMVNEVQEYEYGKFLHIEDPEGNRIELWEPIDAVFSTEPSTEMI